MGHVTNSLNYQAITSAVEVEIGNHMAEVVRRQEPKGPAFCKAAGALLFWRALVGQLDLTDGEAVTFRADSKRLELFIYSPPQRQEWMIGTEARKQNATRIV
ncbi:hypothetical protein [Paraburkholderia fungorum]|uniref:hypothetical protein n=1 Tax=Paraburkholderia fungorum TaxID=134537 RepID=UPI0038B6E9FD